MGKKFNIQRRQHSTALIPNGKVNLQSRSALEREIVQAISDEYMPLVDNYYQTRQTLISILNRIDIIAAMVQLVPKADRAEVLATTLHGFGGALSSAYTEWALAARSVRTPIPNQIYEDFQERLIGINQALNEGDEGAYLYRLAKNHSPLYERIGEIRANIKVGRPATGMQPAQILLLDMAKLERQEKGISWAKAGQRIKLKLEQIPEDKLTATQHEALQLITYQQSTANGQVVMRDSESMAQYLRDLARRKN